MSAYIHTLLFGRKRWLLRSCVSLLNTPYSMLLHDVSLLYTRSIFMSIHQNVNRAIMQLDVNTHILPSTTAVQAFLLSYVITYLLRNIYYRACVVCIV